MLLNGEMQVAGNLARLKAELQDVRYSYVREKEDLKGDIDLLNVDKVTEPAEVEKLHKCEAPGLDNIVRRER